MSKFTSIEELFNTAEQSVGPPTEGGDGNQELRVFQPDRGIDLTYNNPNFQEIIDNRTPQEIISEIEELDKQNSDILKKIKNLL